MDQIACEYVKCEVNRGNEEVIKLVLCGKLRLDGSQWIGNEFSFTKFPYRIEMNIIPTSDGYLIQAMKENDISMNGTLICAGFGILGFVLYNYWFIWYMNSKGKAIIQRVRESSSIEAFFFYYFGIFLLFFFASSILVRFAAKARVHMAFSRALSHIKQTMQTRAAANREDVPPTAS